MHQLIFLALLVIKCLWRLCPSIILKEAAAHIFQLSLSRCNLFELIQQKKISQIFAFPHRWFHTEYKMSDKRKWAIESLEQKEINFWQSNNQWSWLGMFPWRSWDTIAWFLQFLVYSILRSRKVFHCVLAPLQCSLSSGWCELSIQEVHTWK